MPENIQTVEIDHFDDPGAARPGPGSAMPPVTYRRLTSLALPMLAASGLTTLGQVVVLALTGQLGADALYVRSVYMPVAYVFIAVTTGLAVTLQVAVAQAHGRHRAAGTSPERDASAWLASVSRIGVVVFAALGVVLVAGSGLLSAAVAVQSQERGLFRVFLAAMTVASTVGMLGELCSAVLRGSGRALTAALITATYVGLNIAIVTIGVVTGAGLWVVPVAAGVAGLAEIGLGLVALRRRGLVRWPGRRGPRPGAGRLLLSIGVPVGLTSVVLAVVNVLFLRIVAPAGEAAVSGFAVGYSVQAAVIVPGVGLGSAIAVLMNQALPAGGVPAARLALRRGLVLTAVGYAAVTVLLVVAGGPVAGLLTGSPEATVVTRDFLTIAGPTFGCTGLMLTIMTVLEQTGHGPLAVGLNAFYFAAVLALGQFEIARHHHDVRALFWVMAVVTVACLASGLPIAVRAARRPRVLGAGG